DRDVLTVDISELAQALPEFFGGSDDQHADPTHPARLRLGDERRGEEAGGHDGDEDSSVHHLDAIDPHRTLLPKGHKVAPSIALPPTRGWRSTGTWRIERRTLLEYHGAVFQKDPRGGAERSARDGLRPADQERMGGGRIRPAAV